jgi:hypothetical protein
MDMVTMRRQHVAFNISQNPTTVTINRVTKEKQGGGFKNNPSTVGPFTIRIFTAKSLQIRDISNTGGTKKTDQSWAFLADYKADIQADATIQDQFLIEGVGTFRVVSAISEMLNGQRICVKGELERVN